MEIIDAQADQPLIIIKNRRAASLIVKLNLFFHVHSWLYDHLIICKLYKVSLIFSFLLNLSKSEIPCSVHLCYNMLPAYSLVFVC